VEHDHANPSAQGFFRNADECDFHARPHFTQVAQTMPSLALCAPGLKDLRLFCREPGTASFAEGF